MKITVTGNTQSDWVSITEIDVIGGGASSSDTTPPSVTSTSPASGASAFQLIRQSGLTFSEPMLSSGLVQQYLQSKTVLTPVSRDHVSLSSDAKTATFKPSSSLGFSTSIHCYNNDRSKGPSRKCNEWSEELVIYHCWTIYRSSSCDKNAPISAVTAKGAQSGNPASSAVDNNLGTRWSNEGIGSWIRLDLGSEKTVCSDRR